MTEQKGLYLVLVSLHGLIRGENLELGRDADTGGQTKYVVELARALAAQPQVRQVDLLTRRVIDPKVSDDYAQPFEPLADNARIVRLECGPRRYLRKEVLWPHIEAFIDNALQHFRRYGHTPDVIHSHYADAGLAATRLAQILGIPLLHTGHSLGREKQRRLLDGGAQRDTIEPQYHFNERIEAEEITLGNAELVIASTTQEVKQQYAQYENYHPKRMRVIPPGTDLSRFRPHRRDDPGPPILNEINRFLRYPKRPMILALSRADERKNIATLVRAYGETPALREAANLVIIAGNRDDIASMESGPRNVLTSLLLAIDRYDLHGHVALPKHHQPDEVPQIYRLAARSRGLFVNPALTEPFGLTLIEAAASGLPVVATNDGGPQEILAHCKNGVLIDPLDPAALGAALLDGVSDRERWRRWARNGLKGAHAHFSWESHAQRYLKEVAGVVGRKRRRNHSLVRVAKSRLPKIDRLLVCDIDDTLLGDAESLRTLLRRIEQAPHVGLALVTGRSLEGAMKVLKEWRVPEPDLLITDVGTRILYGHPLRADPDWPRHITHLWKPDALRDAMAELPGLTPQGSSHQNVHKISYMAEPGRAPSVREIMRHLRRKDLHAKVIFSHNAFLDVVPVRASKGLAIRHLAIRWGIPPERILAIGDSGNDEEMLRGNLLGVVVANHSRELARLKGRRRVYFAAQANAGGILEGIDYYDFLGQIHIPNDEEGQG